MGWFLVRKPYPGLSNEEKIEIMDEEVMLGRGKECTVHCLSMYVSRHHLTVKRRDDDIFLKDLGSSNGTFINQTKIEARVEFHLNIGDEIGIGNIGVDSSDCYVYIVHRTCEEEPQILPKADPMAKQEHKDLKLKKEQDTKDVKPKLESDEKDLKLKQEQGTKDVKPELESDGKDLKVKKELHELEIKVKKELHEQEVKLKKELHEQEMKLLETNRLEEDIEGQLQSEVCSSTSGRGLKRCAMEPEVVELSDDEDVSELLSISSKRQKIDGDSDTVVQLLTEGPITPTESSPGTSVSPDSSSNKLKEDLLKESLPCPPAVPLNSVKPLNRRLSTLIGESADSSAGTFKVSSPSQSSSCFSAPGTPLKLNNSKDVKPLLTSTPSNTKTEEAHGNPSTSKLSTDWSPIGKESSRNSPDSSANYTLDEEVIPIESSDDDDEDVFPCSQMFSEENDIKPCLDELEKQNIIDLSLDDDQVENEVVILSSDDDEEEEDEDADRWFKKLSQCSLKIEEDDEKKEERTMTDHNEMIEMELRELEFQRNIHETIEQDFRELDDNIQKTYEVEKEKEKHEVGRNAQETHRASEERQKESHKQDQKIKVQDYKCEKIKASTSETIHKSKRDEMDKGRKRERKDKDRRHIEKSSKHKDDDRKRKKETHSLRPGKQESKEARRESRETRDDPLRRLKEIFSDSESEEETGKMNSSIQTENLPVSFSLHTDQRVCLEPTKNILIRCTRVEDDPVLCEQYNLSNSNSSSPNPPSPQPESVHASSAPPSIPHPSSPLERKKFRRTVELVDALPNPTRRAKNRGISGPSAMKIYEDSREGRRRSSDDPKTSKHKVDSKTIRKEKLAKVAAESCSKEGKESSESKRGAPAKVKITSVNRGSFLVDGDEASPARKLRSRKDVVGKMKIPKVKDKDKTAVNLPTKSPLQEMNMSWEKDKAKDKIFPVHSKVPATSTASCSRTTTTPSEPLEIPTGPQPKKRIAQVPPPGFVDGPSGSAIRFQAPIKSCLGGSSKHNIKLNSSKTESAPKKRVQFKENLEEICWIDRVPGTRPLGSSKDADRPKAMSETVKLPKLPASDEAVLQDVIYDIAKWNPIWLREEKNLPPDQPPPVVSNMKLPPLPKTEFLDFEEYQDTMYPLLMLDLWASVSKEYNLHISDSRSNMIMAVDSAQSSPVLSRPDRMLTTLNCHMLVDSGNAQNCHPRLGNLVIVDLALKDASGKSVVIPVFGYVGFDTKNRLGPLDKVHKDLVGNCRNPAFKARFSLIIRERKNCTYVLDRPMRLKNVKYVRGDLRVFQALKALQCMPLLYSIISPSAANEDFTLPDASSRHLAFPERLNPTQERVVLQTAEVCRQDKPKICLIQGPPGTGKSQVILSLVMQLLYGDGIYSRANREHGKVPRILLCAPSNNAVDVLVRRLLVRRQLLYQAEQPRFKMVRVGQPQHIHPDVKGISLKELALVDIKNQAQSANDPHLIHGDIAQIDAKLKGVENIIRDLSLNNKPIPQELMFRKADYMRKKKILDDRLNQVMDNNHQRSKVDLGMEREAMKKLLRGADIVATTLTSCYIKMMETVFAPTSKDNHYHFQVCIVDEATQCMESETLIPLMLGVKTLVLVGDPNQLPATIMSKVARDKGLGTSLFSRLMKTVPTAVQALDVQYRMHPEILKWPNTFFYNKRLQTPPHIASCRDSKVRPYAVLSLPFTQDPKGEVNQEEAKFVLQLAETIIEKKVIPHEFRIGIVTPYQSQRRALQDLRDKMKRLNNVEINTIDSFQGQEKDVILISCVRTSGVGFMADKQRLNVALTRAKYALFICGNFASLDRDFMWNNLLGDSRQRRCFLEFDPRFNFHSKEDIWNKISK